MTKLITDEKIFGVDRYVWCSAHKRTHVTGWCCAEHHGAKKILMNAQTAQGAADEAKHVLNLDTRFQ